MAGLQRLSRAFLERPGTILQELVNAAVDLCGADSQGLALKKSTGAIKSSTTGSRRPGLTLAFWVRFCRATPVPAVCVSNAVTHSTSRSPRSSSIFSGWKRPGNRWILTLEDRRETRGTIFVMAHGRTDAFDQNDARLMTMLADFAAMGYRQLKQQAQLISHERGLLPLRWRTD